MNINQDWEDAITAWRLEQRAAGKADTTIRLRTSWLRRFAAETRLAPDTVTRRDIIGWLAGPEWKPETRRSAKAALKLFYEWAVADGHLAVSPAATLPKVRVPRPRPRPAPDDAITSAMHAASPRVLLMLMLGSFAGLRRAEISRVHTHDLVGDVLHVAGKGGVHRDVPLPASLAAAIRALPAGWVFPSGSVSGHLTPGYVGKLLSRALPGQWTAHTLRHAAATAWHAAGLDLHELAELLGHESVRTTQVYVAISPSRLAPAVELAARRL